MRQNKKEQKDNQGIVRVDELARKKLSSHRGTNDISAQEFWIALNKVPAEYWQPWFTQLLLFNLALEIPSLAPIPVYM
jgi:hypothetical protein